MSSTTTSTVTTSVPTPPDDPSVRSGLIAAATGAANLIAISTKADPDLAAMLSGQSAVQSRALYGPILTAVATWLLTKYAMQLDPATVNAVTGLLAVGVGMVFRYIAKAPITGFFKAAPVASLGPKA
jgi:hypothetical protein